MHWLVLSPSADASCSAITSSSAELWRRDAADSPRTLIGLGPPLLLLRLARFRTTRGIIVPPASASTAHHGNASEPPPEPEPVPVSGPLIPEGRPPAPAAPPAAAGAAGTGAAGAASTPLQRTSICCCTVVGSPTMVGICGGFSSTPSLKTKLSYANGGAGLVSLVKVVVPKI